ncbi:hypothetical protein [Mycoplasma nasistruthionis]|uniref:Uncharacterized protein n=1 Tax=Mycoplasma nasistruthionis TaxID=353852 RepID=A0A5B7XWY0_9MOLU|nr:hypothetical protein [Mycoplasma nasistruthionis]QCZ36433.1 hypothetical protein FG904_00100 [Mycoplasma nasistruthionis]
MPFYQEIDPESKLKNIILDSANNGLHGYVSLANELGKTNIIQDAFDNLQNKLTELQNNNELTLDKVLSSLTESFFNESNILKLVGAIAKSDLVNHDKPKLIDALNTVLTNLFTQKSDVLANLATSFIYPPLRDLGVSRDSITEVLKQVIENPEFSK